MSLVRTTLASPALGFLANEKNITNAVIARKRENEKSVLNIMLAKPGAVVSPFATCNENAIIGLDNLASNIKKYRTELLALLIRLHHQNLLPNKIFISGEGDHAEACLMMANLIYKEFADKIKIHICLIDPYYVDMVMTKPEATVVPPNIVTFTTLYNKVVGIQKALDAADKAFKFANPHTTISKFGFEKAEAVVAAQAELLKAVNGVDSSSHIERAKFFNRQHPINSECSNRVASVINQLSGDKKIAPKQDFNCSSFSSSTERSDHINNLHANQSSNQTVSYESVKSLQQEIIARASKLPNDFHRCEIFFTDNANIKHRYYVSPQDKRRLQLIASVKKASKGDKYHIGWSKVNERMKKIPPTEVIIKHYQAVKKIQTDIFNSALRRKPNKSLRYKRIFIQSQTEGYIRQEDKDILNIIREAKNNLDKQPVSRSIWTETLAKINEFKRLNTIHKLEAMIAPPSCLARFFCRREIPINSEKRAIILTVLNALKNQQSIVLTDQQIYSLDNNLKDLKEALRFYMEAIRQTVPASLESSPLISIRRVQSGPL